jgi:hypothetical protein
MICHYPRAPAKHYPGKQAAYEGISDSYPQRGDSVHPAELPGVTNEYCCGKISRAVSKRRQPWPDIASGQNKVAAICGGFAVHKAYCYRHRKKEQYEEDFPKHFADPPVIILFFEYIII